MSFLSLPDTDAAAYFTASRLDGAATQRLEHASGRPWLIGRWRGGECQEFRGADNAIALFGSAYWDIGNPSKEVANLRSGRDLSCITRRILGSYHLIATVGGVVYAQGSVATTRQIFFARHEGTTLASDRALLLARVLRQGIENDLVALNLLAPFGAPWPLSEASLWSGVRTVSGSWRLVIDGNTDRLEKWWKAPAPELPLEQATGRIAASLEGAVRARAKAGRRIAADLSGGMDSSTLAFLAAETDAHVTTTHVEPLDPTNDDSIWAKKCREALPDVDHRIISRGTAPPLYSDVDQLDIDAEAPSPFTRARPHYRHLASVVADAGADCHLGGVGGDELFLPSVLCVTSIVRTNPTAALKNARFFKNRYRWTWRQTLSIARPMPTFHQWLSNVAGHLDFDRMWGEAPEQDWEVVPRLPLWATQSAVKQVGDHLERILSAPLQPLAPGPADHAILRLMQTNGRAVRLNNRVAQPYGVQFEAPYADDPVIEAALSVRLPDRLSNGRPKAVLAEAMKGRVPYVFERETKGDSSAEIYEGLRQSRPLLHDLCSGLLLADRGLVDEDTLRRTVFGLHADTRPLMPFDATLGLELWLRTAQAELTKQKESDIVDFG